jgi:hypothetical protein
MSQDFMELRGSRVIELRRLDRILSDLARPTLEEDSMAPSIRAALMEIGIVVSGEASRAHLIERLWAHKRNLLRRAGQRADWGPWEPVA